MTFLKVLFFFMLIAQGTCYDISGGVNLNILCYPRQIILNQTFYINIKYLSYLDRPIDIHVEFYDDNNILFQEKKIKMSEQLGYVSIDNIINNTQVKNITTNILITPKNEPKINILTFKKFNLIVADKKDNNCKYFLYQGSTPSLVPSIDSIFLKSYELNLLTDSNIKIHTEYHLVSFNSAILEFYLIGNNNNIINTGSKIIVQKGINFVTGYITIPRIVIHSPIYTTVYVAVYMVPINGSLISNFAQDKTYLTNFIN